MATTQTQAKIGWKGSVGIAVETTAGTAVSPSTYLPVTTCDLQGANNLVSRSPIRKQKGQALSGPGQYAVTGGWTSEFNPGIIGTVLGLAFGADSVSTKTHTFSLASPLNTFTASVDYGGGTTHQFSGCKIDQLDISCKAKDMLTAKVSVMGMNDTPIDSSLSPTYNAPEQPFYFEDIATATINGSSLKCTDFTFTLKNNIQPAWVSGDGRFASQMNETEAEVSGTMTVQYEDESIFDLINDSGVPVATEVALSFTHPVSSYTLDITLPNVLITAGPITLDKKNVQTQALKFSCFASTSSAADDMTIALTNLSTTSYVT